MPIHPRLQMIENGGREVNALRAQLSAVVVSTTTVEGLAAIRSVRSPALQSKQQHPPLSDVTDLVSESGSYRPKARTPMAKQAPADDCFVNIYLELARGIASDEDLDNATKYLHSCAAQTEQPLVGSPVLRKEDLFLAAVPVSELSRLADHPGIRYVYPADRLVFDAPQNAVPPATRPHVKRFALSSRHNHGAGVLIGIVDVGGFDFAHDDFLADGGGTRFVRIWDQGADFRDPPRGFSYGAEFNKRLLDEAIQQANDGGIPAHWMERQSQLSPGSHGTHVASIAAGKYGVCPNAEIAAVLIALPSPSDPDDARRRTFSDSSRIIHALEYLWRVAEERNKSLVVNVSLGTNGGAHDGSSPVTRWLDSRLRDPGRAISVAAGNAGQEAARSAGDIGFAMGRVHTSGRLQSPGLTVDLRWFVAGGDVADFSENELELWLEPQDRITVLLQAPDSDTWIEVAPQQFVKNRRLANGTHVSIFNELYHPSNGSNYVAIYLSPNLETDNWQPVRAGIWTVRLRGEKIRDGRYHGWIERDDPIIIGDPDDTSLWRFPSFFWGASNVDSHSINSLACAHQVIAVANLDSARARINVTSSQGPTRDGRKKPEVCAPGTAILAANGFARPDEDKYIAKTGTSMASPYVAGVMGLMFAIKPDLTAAQCLAILQATAQPLPGTDYAWRDDSGFGEVDVDAALRAVAQFDQRREL